MKILIENFIIFLFLFLILWIGVSYVMQNVKHTGARDFHSAVVKKIEDSNFEVSVIEECRKQAEEAGYELVVSCYGHKQAQSAKVALSYRYTIPVIQAQKEYVIEGYSR